MGLENKEREIIKFDDSPTDEKEWIFYVALPYSYNPEEAYKYATFYRNSLVNMGMFSYNPICETHSSHVEYMELMTGNLDSEMGDEIFQILIDMNRNAQTTIIMVTHNEGLAKRTERIIRLFDGCQVN